MNGERFTTTSNQSAKINFTMNYDNNISPYLGFGLNAPVYKILVYLVRLVLIIQAILLLKTSGDDQNW